MKHERQVEILKETFAHIDANTTPLSSAPYWNPSSRYTSSSHFELEKKTLFGGQMPLLAGFSPDLPNRGSWFTFDIPNAPIFLVRDKEGRARAFLNICRHRGSRLVGFEMDASGQYLHARGQAQSAISCAYHAWTYDLKGTLIRHANDMGGFKMLEQDMHCGKFNLQELPCIETGGMLLIKPQGEVVSASLDALNESFALPKNMVERMGEFGFDNFHLHQEIFGDFKANWKLLIETFMEGYHIPSLHRDTLAARFRSYPVIFEYMGPHALFPLPRKSIDQQRDLPEEQWDVRKHASTVFVVSPHAVLNIPMDGHMELWDFSPISAGHTRARMRFYIPKPAESDDEKAFWDKSWKITTDVIFREDFIQQQNIQSNLASGRLPGVVFGQNEPVLGHFHSELGKITGAPNAHWA